MDLNRQGYLVIAPATDAEVVVTACGEVLEVVGPDADRAEVDAFWDAKELPLEVVAAFKALRTVSPDHSNGMAVPLDLLDADQRQILRRIAAWTIHAEVFGAGGELAGFDDGGSSISVRLTAEQANDLAARLRLLDGVELVTMKDWQDRKRRKARRRR